MNANGRNSAGNWSEVAMQNISVDIATDTTVVTDPSSGGVPPWVFGLIGAVLLLTLVALVVVVIFIVNRRFCFHWFNKARPTGAVCVCALNQLIYIGLPVCQRVCVCDCSYISFTGRGTPTESSPCPTHQLG